MAAQDSYEAVDFCLSEGIGQDQTITTFLSHWPTKHYPDPLYAYGTAYMRIVHENGTRGYGHPQRDSSNNYDHSSAWWADISLGYSPWFDPILDMFSPAPMSEHEFTPVLPDPTPQPILDMFMSAPTSERELTPVLPELTPQPIPEDVEQLAQHINSLPGNRKGKVRQFPSRNTLKKDDLLRGEVSRKTGCLRLEARGSRLRKWYGDERLFEMEMWRYLTEERYASVTAGVGGGRKRKSSSEEGGGEDRAKKHRKMPSTSSSSGISGSTQQSALETAPSSIGSSGDAPIDLTVCEAGAAGPTAFDVDEDGGVNAGQGVASEDGLSVTENTSDERVAAGGV